MEDFREYQFRTSLLQPHMPQEYCDDIYHYTSFKAMESILFSDKNNITLWASRYDCLNDTSEGTVAQIIYIEVCEKLYQEKKINEQIYMFLKEILATDEVLFIKSIDNIYRGRTFVCDRYISSFSQNPDSLAMWNYYSKGNKYDGCNIMMFASDLQSGLYNTCQSKITNIHIYPIVYNKSTQQELIRNTLLETLTYYDSHKDEVKKQISSFLLDWGLIFKSEYFKHEEEVRVIVDIPKSTSDTTLGNDFFEVKYRTNCGYIVPYIELKIPKEELGLVTLGPLLCSEENKKIQELLLLDWLKTNGYNEISTYSSKVPIRY